MSWIEVKVITTNEAVESINNYLFEIGAEGIVIEDPKDILFLENHMQNWDMIDDSLLNQSQENVIVKGYIQQKLELQDQLALLRDYIAHLSDWGIFVGDGTVEVNEVDNENWEESWKAQFKPIKIGDRIVVVPTWETYHPIDDELIIQIDPGLSFGTGSHETTSMCIRMLEKHVKENDSVLDVGTGTGILAIAASKLAAKKVVAIDIDEKSIEIAKENIFLNEVSQKTDVKLGNLLDGIEQKFSVIVANLFAELLVSMSDKVAETMNADGIFIATGILDSKEKMVMKTYEKNGFYLIERLQMGEWVCLTFSIKGSPDA